MSEKPEMSWKDKTIEELFTRPVRYISIGLVVFVALIFLASCGSSGKISEPFQDADRGATNNSPADTITFPDGFSNVATKCDNGNRVYVLFKGDAAYGGISVVPNDPSVTP